MTVVLDSDWHASSPKQPDVSGGAAHEVHEVCVALTPTLRVLLRLWSACCEGRNVIPPWGLCIEIGASTGEERKRHASGSMTIHQRQW